MGGGGGPTFGGSAGLLRMFNAQVGGQIAWLLPLAGVSLVVGLWTTRRAARTDLRRAGLVLFGVWALVHVARLLDPEGHLPSVLRERAGARPWRRWRASAS